MNLKQNEIKIIKLLISSDNYISSYQIANTTGLNRRYIRDEMSNIKIILKKLGYNLISKPSKGYMIEQSTNSKLNKLSKLIEASSINRENVVPSLPWERQNYIIKYLIEKNNYIKIDELANQLLVSRSTISNDLKKAKNNIKKYSLHLKQKPNYGITVIGDEINKRKPICDFLFTNLKQSEMFYDYLNSFFLNKGSLEYGIIQILNKYNIEMSDFALCDFLLSLSISLSRISSGNSIQTKQNTSLLEGRLEFLVADEIANHTSKYYNVEFNDYEITQIAIQLICKRSYGGLIPQNNQETTSLMNEITDAIFKQTCIKLSNEQFKIKFMLQLEASFLRNFYNEKIRNPLFDHIMEAYPLGYQCAIIASKIIKKNKNVSLSKSEIASFTTLFHEAIYFTKPSKLKTLLICGLGDDAINLTEKIINERLENKIKIIKKIQYYQLFTENITQYDLIISTVPITYIIIFLVR